MNNQILYAFGDELEKIAVLGYLKDWLSRGWHGTPANVAKGIPASPNTWLGEGTNITEKMREPGVMNTLRRGSQHVTSLGGLTKRLPVGNKALTVAFTAPAVYAALKKHDATGQERSRAERFSSVAGTTLGGIAGMGLGSHIGGMGMLAGGMLGSYAGERLGTAPFAGARMRRQQAQMQAPQEQQAYPPTAQFSQGAQ